MDKTETVNAESDQTPVRAYASHVSRVLGRAGFTRGEIESSSLGNMNYYSPGYTVRGCNQSWEWGWLTDAERDEGYLTVERSTMDTHRLEEEDARTRTERRDEDLAAYLTVLEDAGFVVEDRNKGYDHYLVVKGRIR